MFIAIHKTNHTNVMTEAEDLSRLVARIKRHGKGDFHEYAIIRVDGVEVKKGYAKSCAHFLPVDEFRDIAEAWGIDLSVPEESKKKVKKEKRVRNKAEDDPMFCTVCQCVHDIGTIAYDEIYH